MDTINQRLALLRDKMKANNLDAYIIPSSDAHQSEYVADHFKSREWISGFTGSAGTVVVSQDHAGLWTDSRYFLQGDEELASSDFVLHKVINQGASIFINWLIDELPKNSTIGCDGRLFSKGQVDSYEKQTKASGIQINTQHDLIELIWLDRPPLPQSKVYVHDVKFAGKSRADKIQDFRTAFQKDGADIALLTGLDDIAWMLNLRGSDVESNPVFIAYAVVEKHKTLLFLDTSKINQELNSTLLNDDIELREYDTILAYLNSLDAKTKVHVSLADCSVSVYRAINGVIINGANHVRNAKAIKNETEIKHFRNVMEKDAVALIRLYRWLEKEVKSRPVKETEIRSQLAEFRSQLADYVGESFSAIVGWKGNGAIIHYHPKEETCAQVEGSGMLLLDSGGQYLDGTTDITRTTYFGDPSKEEKKMFTLVLQGYIALDQAKFPYGTKGVQLDILARQFLWNNGLNYGHGTGHGVGFFMNVHEPPQGYTAGLSSRGNTTMELGMVTSNEPGFYKSGAYGIRIENLLLNVQDEKTEYGDFISHETLTLFPIELKLIEETLLSAREKAWLNQYHQEVYNRVSPHVTAEEKLWLQEKCKPLN